LLWRQVRGRSQQTHHKRRIHCQSAAEHARAAAFAPAGGHRPGGSRPVSRRQLAHLIPLPFRPLAAAPLAAAAAGAGGRASPLATHAQPLHPLLSFLPAAVACPAATHPTGGRLAGAPALIAARPTISTAIPLPLPLALAVAAASAAGAAGGVAAARAVALPLAPGARSNCQGSCQEAVQRLLVLL
jgi:hypothetical protein